ncbi:hypothetical protein RBSH_06031 [Rhodopirellula baltica SH28]|uniref:Uncharacterized protein n=1 Tax=Rhodopirellula baltica SH28 TaxID=993517 RepID=K5D7D8_RHOBT|nr:hypothetical protein RBSH_06031 [Rhodopirellula baltica SH28]
MDAVHEFVAKLVRGKKSQHESRFAWEECLKKVKSQLLTKVAWTLVSLMSFEMRLQKVALINTQW